MTEVVQGEHYAYFDYAAGEAAQPIRYIFDTLENAQTAAAQLPTLPEWVVTKGMIRQQRPDLNDGWKPSDAHS